MEKVKKIVQLLKKVDYILDARQKRNVILVFIISFVGSLFELLGVSAVIPFIQAILDPQALLKYAIVAQCASFLNIETDMQLILALGVCIILIYVIKNAFLIFSMYVQTSFQVRTQEELSVKMLNSYMHRPYTYFANINSSVVLNSVDGDIARTFDIINCLFKLVAELLTVSAILILLFITDWKLASGVAVFSVIAFVGITKFFKQRMRTWGELQRKFNEELVKVTHHAIWGIKEIIVNDKQEFFCDEYERTYDKRIKTDITRTVAQECPSKIIEAFCVSGIIIMVCVRVMAEPNVVSFVPKLAAFAVGAFRILPSVSRMVSYINNATFLKPSLDAAYQNLKDVENYERELSHKCDEVTEECKIEDIRDFSYLLLKNVWWRYDNETMDVLRGIDLKIKNGQSIAFVGASGAGKTTLSDVILGLLCPQQGKVMIDEYDIFTIPSVWKKIIGYVPQSVFLTDDTIRKNIAFGISEQDIDDERVKQAAHLAQLDTVIDDLPGGINTFVGERGIRLSGGQRQRIAIARALYDQPEILVLDEATSALDNETEKAVMESINALHGKVTLIIVAHRLSTIKNCDEIYEVTGGKAIRKLDVAEE